MRTVNVTRIINSWDPVGKYPYGPHVEYRETVVLIKNFITLNTNFSVAKLSKFIHKIFVREFGRKKFNWSTFDCYPIAQEIVAELSKAQA